MMRFDKTTAKGLKGIAILLMVFHHCFRTTSLYEAYTLSFFPFPEMAVVNLAAMSKICVSIFAFISGYGLFLSYQNQVEKANTTPSRWVLLRYVKTFSGYWFAYFFVVVIYGITGGRLSRVYFSDGFWIGCANVCVEFLGLSKLFGTPTLKGTWWYMSAAFVFILLMPMLYRWIMTKPWVVWTLSLVLLQAFFSHLKGGTYPGANSVYGFLPMYLLGGVSARTDLFSRWGRILLPKEGGEKGGSGRRWLKLGGMLGLLWICYGLYVHLPIETFWILHYCLIPMLVILFCVEYVLRFLALRRVFAFLGAHSMNIFLLHNFFRTGRVGKFLYSQHHFSVILIGLFLLSLGISLVLELLKRKCRYQRAVEWVCGKVMYTSFT